MQPNYIEGAQTCFTATLANGTEIIESPSAGFADVPLEEVIAFKVEVEGHTFSVDLVSGTLIVDTDHYEPGISITTPLRLVYYKTMRANMNQILGADRPYIYVFIVGWQTTLKDELPYRNARFGLKVFPTEQRWEITEVI